MNGKDKTGRDDELFDIGMDAEDSEEDLISYDAQEILPESPTIRGNKRSRIKDLYGREAKFAGGRSISPPLFAEASNFPECTQMRVWKMENGQPVGLGTISSAATEEDLIHEFRSAMPNGNERNGVFKIRPLDINGTELGQEFTKIISTHHAALKTVSSAPSSSPMGGVPTQMIEMLKDTLAASQRALEEERKRTQMIMQQVAQERIDLANQTASGVQTISERMMQADADRQELMLKSEKERNRQAQDNMASFFQSNIEILQGERDRASQLSQHQSVRDQTFYERMMERESLMRAKDRDDSKSHLEQMRQEFHLKMEEERLRRQRDQEEWEKKRLIEKEEYDRKERDRLRELQERRHKDKEEKKEREHMRNREHEMRLKEMDLQAQRDREHQERMMQMQMMANEKETAGSAKSLVKDAVKTLRELGLEPKDLLDKLMGGNDNGSSTTSEVLGAITNIAGSASEVLKESIKAKTPIAPPPSPFPPRPMLPQHHRMEDPQSPMPQPIETNPESLIPAQPPKPTTKLNLFDQRRVRKAMRILVNQLKSSADEKWEGLITASITSEFLIFQYCNDVSVQFALREAGGNQQLSEMVINLLRNHPLVPEQMRYYE